MKVFWKILKWIGLIIGSLLTLVILAGLSFRLLGPAPHEPRGKLVDIGGIKLHIESNGERGNKPTLVIEGGSGVAGEYYHWLNEGLKDSMRVVRYDRAGIGYSDECETPRGPEVIARELHTLLEKAGKNLLTFWRDIPWEGPTSACITNCIREKLWPWCLWTLPILNGWNDWICPKNPLLRSKPCSSPTMHWGCWQIWGL